MKDNIVLSISDSRATKVTDECFRVLDFLLEDRKGELRFSQTLSAEAWESLLGLLQGLDEMIKDYIGDSPTELEAGFQELHERLDSLFPSAIVDRLILDDCGLELRCEGIYIPWELAPCLGGQLSISRAGHRVSVLERLSSSPPTAWLGANADGMSLWAEQEAQAARLVLENEFPVVVASPREMTLRGLSAVLCGGRYALIHLAVYANAEGLVLSDGQMSFEVLERLGGESRPGFVSLHLCCAPESLGLLEDKIAQSFLTLGIPTVLVTAWPTELTVSKVFYQTFYSDFRASFLGDSLREARAKVSGLASSRNLSAHGYMAYGDWSTRGSDVKIVNSETSESAPTAAGSWQADFQLRVLESPKDSDRCIPLFSAVFEAGKLVIIGRSGVRPVDLALPDDSLENQTASLVKTSGKLVIDNLTNQPDFVRVNGLPVYAPVTLEGWEEIWLGETCLRLEPAQASSQASFSQNSGDSFVLELAQEPQGEILEVFALEARVVQIGRQVDCSIRISDPTVSRYHATLVPKLGRFYLSSIGEARVVVNGFLLEGEYELREGDSFQLSPKTHLRFHRQRNPA